MRANQPAYVRVEEALRSGIGQGRWQAGSPLPSRQVLAGEFSVSVGTVQQAIDNLVQADILRTEHGRGTYVTGGRSDSDTQWTYARDDSARGPVRITIVSGVHPSHSQSYLDGSTETILSSMERTCGHMGGSILYCKRQLSGDDWEPIAQTVARIDCSKTDAVVVVGFAKSIETPVDFVNAAESVPVPIVFLSSGELPAAIPHVFYDGRYGGYQAALHLLDKGHDQLMFLSPFRASWSWDRLTGVRQALSQRGLGEAALEVWPAPESVPSRDEMGFMSFEMAREMSYRHSLERLALLEPRRAVLAVSDAVAMGYMAAAKERNLEAGIDYSIVGFDNSYQARDLGLTSLQRPWEAMANEAVTMAFALAQGRYAATQVRMQPHLVPRSSTALAKWQLRGAQRTAEVDVSVDRIPVVSAY